MSTIIGISGSLRSGSYNTALLQAAVSLAPEGMRIEVASLRGIPLYDGDVEAREGVPQAAAQLKERIAAADGLLIVTPEYNHSMPGVLKNAIDWLTRPPGDVPRVFRDKPVALMGATPGKGGTILSQNAWLPVLRALRTRPWFGPPVRVSSAKEVFDAHGTLRDEGLRDTLRDFLRGYAAFVAAQHVTADAAGAGAPSA